ncbi:ROK family protein [Chitinophagaceae bacterium LB-8]|uniref:ROK family protein n=1 Tax=Paraflavisolibacter caeni TaxID=2982496 RepID=A0A9X2XYH0_9BACT|nr:ROK family protein [Paraflavisolibacter caeni]MCU7551550.1 ROK family protein [Paraflavisolibacter caeni]
MERTQQFAIGIDIGGTGTKFGIVNHRGVISHKGDDIATNTFKKVEDFVDALYIALKPAIDQIGINHLKGIGIGAPNGNYYSGTIEYAPNLHWRGIVPLAKLISERFGLPSSLTNDANAAAVGEMMYGAAKGMKDFIVITLGTGVGSGIVANGHLIYGHDGFAGELGHTIIRPGGRKHWSTSLDGSLEAYASATGIAITAREMLENSDKSSLLSAYQPEKINSKIVYDCAMKGDEISKEVYRFTGQILGEALANFVMFSSPEAIILFGGVIKAGDLIMKPTKEHMEKNLLPIFQNKVKLIFSELKEADAAILGASALVWEMRD